MPCYSAAITGIVSGEAASAPLSTVGRNPVTPTPQKTWHVTGAPKSRPPASTPPEPTGLQDEEGEARGVFSSSAVILQPVVPATGAEPNKGSDPVNIASVEPPSTRSKESKPLLDHPVPAKALPRKTGPATKTQSTEAKASLPGGTAVRLKSSRPASGDCHQGPICRAYQDRQEGPCGPAGSGHGRFDKSSRHSSTLACPEAAGTQTAPASPDNSQAGIPSPAMVSCACRLVPLGHPRVLRNALLVLLPPQPGPSQQSAVNSRRSAVGGQQSAAGSQCEADSPGCA